MYLDRLGAVHVEDGRCDPKSRARRGPKPRALGAWRPGARRSRGKQTDTRSASTTSKCATRGSAWEIDASFSSCPTICRQSHPAADPGWKGVPSSIQRVADPPARHGMPFVFTLAQASAAIPDLADNRVPVAARLLALTDHPGLELVVVFIRERDGASDNRTLSRLVMGMARFHDTLRNTRGKRGADDDGSSIGTEPSSLIVRFPAGATPCFGNIFF